MPGGYTQHVHRAPEDSQGRLRATLAAAVRVQHFDGERNVSADNKCQRLDIRSHFVHRDIKSSDGITLVAYLPRDMVFPF